jgi:formylglycine-generating enzyme required for sulfatase activity
VHINAFGLGRFAVTRGEFRRFVEATGYKTDAERGFGFGCFAKDGANPQWTRGLTWQGPGFEQDDRHPVVCVSWNDARAYVVWLSKATAKEYRLPSESEWEYAARAGAAADPYWSQPDGRPAALASGRMLTQADIDAMIAKGVEACRYANLADLTAQERAPTRTFGPVGKCRDGFAYTAPVGSFPPNQFGLNDMLGNASQWVEDCSHPVGASGGYERAPADGRAWVDGKCLGRVVRGAGWMDAYAMSTASFRLVALDGKQPIGDDFRVNELGFRVARTLD